MMKRKMISAVLAAVMTVGMITGCGSSQTTTENKADKADKLESQTDLSLQIMILKKNMHMEILMHIQELTKIVRTESIHLKTKISYSRYITYDQLIDILGSEGNYMIQLSGSMVATTAVQ